MIVKICGLTSVSEARMVSDAGADLAGVVMFFEKSKRNITPEKASEIIKALNESGNITLNEDNRNPVKGVAVMVSPSIEQIKIAETTGVSYLQIHGELTEEMIEAATLPIIKAFNVTDLDKYDYYYSFDKIAGFVMDAAEYGSGKTFDWNLLSNFERGNKLFILAGGLNPDNVANAIKKVNPDGVDVSSGVEYSKDLVGKDPKLVKEFVSRAK